MAKNWRFLHRNFSQFAVGYPCKLHINLTVVTSPVLFWYWFQGIPTIVQSNIPFVTWGKTPNSSIYGCELRSVSNRMTWLAEYGHVTFDGGCLPLRYMLNSDLNWFDVSYQCCKQSRRARRRVKNTWRMQELVGNLLKRQIWRNLSKESFPHCSRQLQIRRFAVHHPLRRVMFFGESSKSQLTTGSCSCLTVMESDESTSGL